MLKRDHAVSIVSFITLGLKPPGVFGFMTVQYLRDGSTVVGVYMDKNRDERAGVDGGFGHPS